MATEYLCKGCNTVFSGVDPIWFGSLARPSYPECPNGPLATYLKQIALPESERDIPEDILALLDKDEIAHPVGLAVAEKQPDVASPQPKAVGPKPSAPVNAWAKGSLVLKEETPEELAARLKEEAAAALRREVAKIEAERAQRVKQLIKRIEAMIVGGGGTKSINFPLDLEYGFKKGGAQLSEQRAIIMLAGAEWVGSAHRTFRGPKWKKRWEQYQANFEQDIVKGDRSKGKHNVHVVVA